MKKTASEAPKYTLGEELFNSISHGVGVLLSIAALVLLIIFAAIDGSGYKLASGIVYGISLILLYSMSMVYHIVQGKKGKAVMRIFDHCSIFILIAGTYTPYLLTILDKKMGWIMFGIIWGMAIIGIVMNSINLEKFKKISLICYIIMGWAIVFTIRPIINGVPFMGVLLLLIGGIVYTAGIIFYIMKKYRYMHSIWHLFVLGGSVCHYLSIQLFVI